MSSPIRDERVATLNDAEARDGGDFVLYWMEASQRADHNEALEYAVHRANEHGVRLLAAAVLDSDEPDFNRRHAAFAVQGYRDTAERLSDRTIKFALRTGPAVKTIASLARDAAEVVVDRGYLRHQKDWRKQLARDAGCRVTQVEANVIVPVETASEKREYAARTIRSQINDAAERFLDELSAVSIDKDSRGLSIDGERLDRQSDVNRICDLLSYSNDVPPAPDFEGGYSAAKRRFDGFLDRLKHYAGGRSDFAAEHTSRLSPYLRFGHISPVEIATSLGRHGSKDDRDEFLEELLVRRELAVNFVYYCDDYDSLKALPDWAADTLEYHKSDDREHVYTAAELEAAETHEDAWNAAMIEMKTRGWLHNHLRMYWGKKIAEWTNTPQFGHRTALKLNNRYFLDGRDPNSYANNLWVYGLHDRAFGESDVIGKTRPMSRDGLDKKADVEAYLDGVER